MIPSHPWRRARSSLFARESRIVPTLAMLRSLGATHGHPRTHAPRRFIFESQKLEMIDRLKTSPPLSPSRRTTPAPGLRSNESAALSIAPPCDDGRNRSPKARACIPALARLDICGAPKNEEVKSMDEFAPLDGAAPNATVDLSALVKRTLQDFATDMPGSPMMGGMTSMVPCS